MSDEKTMGQVIQIDEARIRDHLGEMVRGTVEETLNAVLDAEAVRLCGAARYERSNLVGSDCQPGPGHAVKARQDGPRPPLDRHTISCCYCPYLRFAAWSQTPALSRLPERIRQKV